MSLFDPSEKVEFLAVQSLNYDKYSDSEYFLERVDVGEKCGLVCGEHSTAHGTHSRVLLPPVYQDIEILKISSHKALYNKYAVFANGTKIGQFTLVLNSWVPSFQKN